MASPCLEWESGTGTTGARLRMKTDKEITDSPNREEALRLRYDANDQFELARNLLGAVILNHAISAIEARIVATNHNKKKESRAAWFKPMDLDLRTTVLPAGVESQLVLRTRF